MVDYLAFRGGIAEWRVSWLYFVYVTTPSPIFWAKRTIWRILRQKISERKFFFIFFIYLFFPEKTHFGPNIFTKLHPHLFSGPNDLCGAFQGKIVTEENFARFYLT